jgi:FAD/FMN-containing dehydrogenase
MVTQLHVHSAHRRTALQAVLEELEPYIFEWTQAAAGSISAEHGVGSHKKAILHYSQPPESIELMGKIKALLDPRGTLNPGKLITFLPSS